jgi:hypothetical protein
MNLPYVYDNEDTRETSLAAIQSVLLRECHQLKAHITAAHILTQGGDEESYLQGMTQLVTICEYRFPAIARDIRLTKKNLAKESQK